MATKSFTTEFKFSQKNAHKLLNAIENSRKVNHEINKRVTNISDKGHIDDIMKSFLEGK